MTSDTPRRSTRRRASPTEGSMPESAAPSQPLATGGPEPATPAMRLQILSTEHWSLLASRNLAWTESFARAGMFLSTLSFAVVALALVAQASDFGEAFRLFALVILPVVLLLGIATQLRLDSANNHDAVCVVGMNRIRAAYLELAPDLERYLVMGTTDDLRGITTTMAVLPDRSAVANALSATPVLVGVLNSVLIAAIAALVAIQLGADSVAAILTGAAAFLGAMIGFGLYVRKVLQGVLRSYRPLFPTRERPTNETARPG